MNIEPYIEEFANKNHRGKPYSKIVKSVLLGGKEYSLNSKSCYRESEYLSYDIQDCVQRYPKNKDHAIALFKALVEFLEDKGVGIPEIKFPEIPVSNTFERLMYIAKYIQAGQPISELPNKLWVSDRTIEEDLSRLRGYTDPIQVQGRKFFIPDDTITRENGRFIQQSTMHPIFLAENLTQVLTMLKGLKIMAENPLYRPYAEASGREIWNQLSLYARKRIRFVLRELLPEDLEWYESLTGWDKEDGYFHTERDLSVRRYEGASVVLDCMKNGKSFCVEYDNNGEHLFYKDCLFDEEAYRSDHYGIPVNCSAGRIRLQTDQVIRSAYTIEELTAD